MYKIYVDGVCIHDDQLLDDEVKVINPKLTLSDNSSGSFTFTIPTINVGYSVAKRMISVVNVIKNGSEIWSGRIIDEREDFWKQRVVTCEGELSYLNDTTQPVVKYLIDNSHPIPSLESAFNNLGSIDKVKDAAYRLIKNPALTHIILDQIDDPSAPDYYTLNNLVALMTTLGYSHVADEDADVYLFGYVTKMFKINHQRVGYANNKYPHGEKLYISDVKVFVDETNIDGENIGTIYPPHSKGVSPLPSPRESIYPSESEIELYRKQGYFTGLELIAVLLNSIDDTNGEFTISDTECDKHITYEQRQYIINHIYRELTLQALKEDFPKTYTPDRPQGYILIPVPGESNVYRHVDVDPDDDRIIQYGDYGYDYPETPYGKYRGLYLADFYGFVLALLNRLDYTLDSFISAPRPYYPIVQNGYEKHYERETHVVKKFLEILISVHNSKVTSDKQFTVGNVTVTDPNNTLYKITNHNTTMECIKEKLIDTYGGHIVIRKENGVRYIDYLSDFKYTNPQTIEFGRNLLDYTKNFDLTDLATVILPLGASIGETPDGIVTLYTTVESVNNGSPYVISENARATYGWIEKVVSWDDVTTPENLLKRAQDYLQIAQFENLSIEVSAVDLSLLNPSISDFKLLDMVRVISSPHGLDKVFPISKITIPLDKPEETSYVIGNTEKLSLTSIINK